MRIKVEDLKILKKKDRDTYQEELKQLYDKRPNFECVIASVKVFIGFIAFSFIILPLWKLAFSTDGFITMAISVLAAVKLSLFIIQISLVIDFIRILLFLRKISKHNNNYFYCEIKSRRNK